MEAAISDDTVVISAVFEDSSATSVNGDQSSNGARDSGAAYVFTGVGPRPRITIEPEAFGGCFIRFDGIPGWTYELQRALSINGEWSTFTTSIAPASGVVEFLDPTPPEGQAFYRVAMP
ncbi:MAG TPA: hypothetical protein VM656_08590 [Pyrinomonadaceae bacterium]|jgi:hypothetical protein|nr:hypothetical protein [Pyrinomonadaceae bacterium]